jgi:hypothetical protein
MPEKPKLAASTAGYLALAAFNCVLLLSYLGSHPNFPGDFCAFYTGARIYLQDPSRVYDLTLQRATEQQLIGRDDIPFNHPPYELLLWLPLARLSFHAAFWVWRFAQFSFAGCCLETAGNRAVSATGSARDLPARAGFLPCALLPVDGSGFRAAAGNSCGLCLVPRAADGVDGRSRARLRLCSSRN